MLRIQRGYFRVEWVAGRYNRLHINADVTAVLRGNVFQAIRSDRKYYAFYSAVWD